MIRTTFLKDALDEKEATTLFEYLRSNIEWEEGIRSRKGFTRVGKDISLEDPVQSEVLEVILKVLPKLLKIQSGFSIEGIYLNYYLDGNSWLPNHSHPGSKQLIISLGATRTLEVSKKDYQMTNGSAIIFGSAIHGMKKDPSIKEGRISIATFMTIQ